MIPHKVMRRRWNRPHQRAVWWLFDLTPRWFQDWAEAWARTLIVHRNQAD